jgi:sulfide:quinone oxidoreductase
MASTLILGGGFGGLAAAHQPRARLSDDHDVTVVAANDHFYAGFAKLWDLVGTRPLEQGTASLSALERYGICFVQTRITAIDPTERRVETEAGSFSADFLLVALGADPGPEQLLQLHGPAHDLYDANELPEVRADLAHLDAGDAGGRGARCALQVPTGPLRGRVLARRALAWVRGPRGHRAGGYYSPAHDAASRRI